MLFFIVFDLRTKHKPHLSFLPSRVKGKEPALPSGTSVKDRGPCHGVTVASMDGEKTFINGGKLHQCGAIGAPTHQSPSRCLSIAP